MPASAIALPSTSPPWGTESSCLILDLERCLTFLHQVWLWSLQLPCLEWGICIPADLGWASQVAEADSPAARSEARHPICCHPSQQHLSGGTGELVLQIFLNKSASWEISGTTDTNLPTRYKSMNSRLFLKRETLLDNLGLSSARYFENWPIKGSV